MKTALLLCALCLSFAAAAQLAPLPLSETNGRVVYSLVIEAPGASQADLYGRALRWMAALPQIGNQAAVHDAASGMLAARAGAVFVSQAGAGTMPCTLWREVSVQVKDGRVKYEASDFAVQYYVASAAALSPPTAAQVRLHPMEEFTDRAAGRYYTKAGQPRPWTASLLSAAGEQTAGQTAALRRALLSEPGR